MGYAITLHGSFFAAIPFTVQIVSYVMDSGKLMPYHWLHSFVYAARKHSWQLCRQHNQPVATVIRTLFKNSNHYRSSLVLYTHLLGYDSNDCRVLHSNADTLCYCAFAFFAQCLFMHIASHAYQVSPCIWSRIHPSRLAISRITDTTTAWPFLPVWT